MAWSTPPSFTAGEYPPAAKLQTLSDDLVDLDRRTSPVGAVVAGIGTTTSPTFADLATGGVGPAVAVTIGASGKAWVAIHCKQSNSTAGEVTLMGIDVSGATTRAATDDDSLTFTSPTANGDVRHGTMILMEGLNAGSTTFTAKYRRTNGTGSFAGRRIAVTPLGS